MNTCYFSECRNYRYSLLHRWDELFSTSLSPRRVVFIGLNPSTADENQLDPTLKRLKDFATRWGFSEFMMLNTFAFRATDPEVMKQADEPVGPENDEVILRETGTAELVVVAWGNHCSHRGRDQEMKRLLQGHPNVRCFELSKEGFPKHPLYLPGTLTPVVFPVS